MKKLSLNYHKNKLCLAVMLVIPITGSAALLLVLFQLPKESSGMIHAFAIVFFIILMAFVLHWLINKHIIIPCEVTTSQSGFKFSLLRKSIIYRKQNFYTDWENVVDISEVFCSFSGKYFYKIEFANPKMTANFSPQKNKEAEADCLFSEFEYYLTSSSKIQSENQEASAKIWLQV